MASPPLACTVRGCAQPLERHDRAWTCRHGHSFDISRSGYVNLVQPQDRRSLSAGDSKAAVDARADLLASGIGRAIIDWLVNRVTALALPDEAVVVDLGCGSGDALAALAAAREISGVGIDLSIAAIERAAKSFNPHLSISPDRHLSKFTWVVGNADRRLPLVDHSVDLIVSIHGRRNPSECARTLKPNGMLLAAVPAFDDLIELRALVQGQAVERDRGDAVVAEHAALFTLVDRATVRRRHQLDRESLLKLLRGTYRGERRVTSARVQTLGPLQVTLASDFLLFARR